jgi:hypothetical protein
LFCCFAALAIGKTRRPFIEKNFFFEKLLDSGGLHISYRYLITGISSILVVQQGDR